MTVPTLLAQDGEFTFPIHLIIVFVLLLLSALKSLYDKAREQEARRQQAESQRQRGRSLETPDQGGSVEDIVRTMRRARKAQARGGTPPVPTAQRRPVPQARPAPSRQARQAQRRRPVSEAARPQPRANRRQAPPQSLRAEATPEPEAIARPIAIDLTDRREARKGIVLAEILGPPVGLRRQPGMWDM
ncbi:MAG: hypothetical protein ACOC95_09950 [Planctomycetota bacterium]